MGKGTIVGETGEGLYTIKINLDRTRTENLKTTIQAQIDRISAVDLVTKQADYVTAKNESDTAYAALQVAIDDLIAGTGSEKTVRTATEAYREKLVETKSLQSQVNAIKLRKVALQKELEYLEAEVPDDPEVSAWCADFTEGLSGEVGTIEIPGERTEPVIIRPGFDGNVYTVDDGQIQPAIAGHESSVYYNLAMLPGWQKWRPTYRLARITAIDHDTDTCDLAMIYAESSAQALPVNQASTLTGVPIEYMDCDSYVFDVDDRVVVKFEGQDWSSPKVIGFESNPKECAVLRIIVTPSHNNNLANSLPYYDKDGVYIKDVPTGVSWNFYQSFACGIADDYWFVNHDGGGAFSLRQNVGTLFLSSPAFDDEFSQCNIAGHKDSLFVADPQNNVYEYNKTTKALTSSTNLGQHALSESNYAASGISVFKDNIAVHASSTASDILNQEPLYDRPDAVKIWTGGTFSGGGLVIEENDFITIQGVAINEDRVAVAKYSTVDIYDLSGSLKHTISPSFAAGWHFYNAAIMSAERLYVLAIESGTNNGRIYMWDIGVDEFGEYTYTPAAGIGLIDDAGTYFESSNPPPVSISAVWGDNGAA